jgi:hypothetical protein
VGIRTRSQVHWSYGLARRDEIIDDRPTSLPHYLARETKRDNRCWTSWFRYVQRIQYVRYIRKTSRSSRSPASIFLRVQPRHEDNPEGLAISIASSSLQDTTLRRLVLPTGRCKSAHHKTPLRFIEVAPQRGNVRSPDHGYATIVAGVALFSPAHRGTFVCQNKRLGRDPTTNQVLGIRVGEEIAHGTGTGHSASRKA